jgi:hypothetical protein
VPVLVGVIAEVRFPVDDAELSGLHHRAFSPDQPETDAAILPWAHRLERHSLTWVGAFSAGRLVGFGRPASLTRCCGCGISCADSRAGVECAIAWGR